MAECITCRHFQKKYFGRHVVCYSCFEYSRYEADHGMLKKLAKEDKQYETAE